MLKIAFSKTLTILTTAISLALLVRTSGVGELSGFLDLATSRFQDFTHLFWGLPLKLVGLSITPGQSMILTLSLMVGLPAHLQLGRLTRSARTKARDEVQSKTPSPWTGSGVGPDAKLVVLVTLRAVFVVIWVLALLADMIEDRIGFMLFAGYIGFSLVFWYLVTTLRYREAASMIGNLIGGIVIVLLLVLAGFIELFSG